LGLLIAFLPIIPNDEAPKGASISTSQLLALDAPGLIISIIGISLLSYAMYAANRGISKSYLTRNFQSKGNYYKMILSAFVAGSIFSISDIIQAVVIPPPKSLQLPVLELNLQNLGVAFLAGAFVGCCVSFYSLTYPYRGLAKTPVLRTVIYSFIALALIAFLDLLGHLTLGIEYFLYVLAINFLRFLVLGLVLGYYVRPPAVKVKPIKS
jgi:hypothetical protein